MARLSAESAWHPKRFLARLSAESAWYPARFFPESSVSDTVGIHSTRMHRGFGSFHPAGVLFSPFGAPKSREEITRGEGAVHACKRHRCGKGSTVRHPFVRILFGEGKLKLSSEIAVTLCATRHLFNHGCLRTGDVLPSRIFKITQHLMHTTCTSIREGKLDD